MTVNGYLTREESVVWRDIAGEVVIAERDNSKVRTLNKVASLIWMQSDGSKQLDDIVTTICDKFEVDRKQAQVDSEEFCGELIEANLISLTAMPRNRQEV